MAANPKQYTIGLITCIPREHTAVVLDETYERPPMEHDGSSYTYGRIDKHNVVFACLPGRGIVEAGHCVDRMESEFEALRFIVLLGVAGAAPSAENDIRLGDVVVSVPNKNNVAVLQVDYGTKRQGRPIDISDIGMGQPADAALTGVYNLHSHAKQQPDAYHLERKLVERAREVATKFPAMSSSQRPTHDDLDVLFKTEYLHQGSAWDSCMKSQCSPAQRVERKERTPAGLPRIHQGVIGTGNIVVRDARARDRLAEETGVLCFEMEAAALKKSRVGWLVVRGICDYSDTHKNKDWQDHAAAVAAAYVRELLYHVPTLREQDAPKAVEKRAGNVSQTNNFHGSINQYGNSKGLIGANISGGTINF